jgi:hypothetical protein
MEGIDPTMVKDVEASINKLYLYIERKKKDKLELEEQKEVEELEQKLKNINTDLSNLRGSQHNNNEEAVKEYKNKIKLLKTEVDAIKKAKIKETPDVSLKFVNNPNKSNAQDKTTDEQNPSGNDLSMTIKNNKNNPSRNDLSMIIKNNENNLELEINGDEFFKALDLKAYQHIDFFKEEDRDFWKVVEGLLPKDAGGKPEWGALAIAAPIVVFNMMMNAMICTLANIETFNKERSEKREKMTAECAAMGSVEMEDKMGNDMLTSWALTPSKSEKEVDMKLGILKAQGFDINEDIQEKMRNVPNSPLVTMFGGIQGGLLYETANGSYKNGDKLLELKARMDGYKQNKNYTTARDNINKNLAGFIKDKTPLPQIKESVDRIEELMDPWQTAYNKIENERKAEEIKNSPPKPNIGENKPIKSEAQAKTNKGGNSVEAKQMNQKPETPGKEEDLVNNGKKESAQPPLPGEDKKIKPQNPGEQGSVASSNKEVLDQVTGNNSFVRRLKEQNQKPTIIGKGG